MMKTGAFLASLSFNSSTVMRAISLSALCSAAGGVCVACDGESAGLAGAALVAFADFLAFDFDFVLCASATLAKTSIATISSSAHFLRFIALLLCGLSGTLILPCAFR